MQTQTYRCAMFFSLIFLILFAVIPPTAAEEYFLPAGTPLFRNTEISGRPAAFVPKDMLGTVTERSTAVFRIGALRKNADILKVSLRAASGGDFWVIDGIGLQVDPRTQKSGIYFLPYIPQMAGGICLFALALILFLFFIRGKDSCHLEYPAFAVIILVQWGLVLYMIGRTANIMLNPLDDLYYYQIAADIARLDFSGPWRYTVGLPLVYLPFVCISGCSSFADMNLPFNIFNAFVVMPFLLCMAYLIIRKFSSPVKALSSVLIWDAAILFLRHRYLYFDKDSYLDSYIMASFPGFPNMTFSYSLYDVWTLLGYNAMSDTVSCALLFACAAMILYMRPVKKSLILFAALYAFACLVRINNILFAPLMAFCLYLRYAPTLRDWKQWVLFLISGAVPFLFVFSIQLFVNKMQLGSFWAFPYVLHSYQNVSKGFLFQMLPFGIPFLEICNHACFAAGTIALFFVSDKKNRILLTLWTLPLTFFFFGYPVVYNNATRFILPVFMGFAGALALTDVWAENVSARLRAASILLSNILLTAPARTPGMEQYLPWNWFQSGMSISTANMIRYGVILFSIAVLVSFFIDVKRTKCDGERRDIWRTIAFLSGFLILFQWGNPYAVASVMLLALLRAVYDVIRVVRETVRTNPVGCGPEDSGLT